ncbi:hypothetical protein SLE2022_394580 [Rubroshorea leprosula]
MCNGKECMNKEAFKATQPKRHAPESKSAPGRGSGDDNQGGARRNGDEKWRRKRGEEEKLETLLQLIFWGPN